MDSIYNPPSDIQKMTTRQLVMQILARIWCIIFSIWIGLTLVFKESAIAHMLLIAGVFVTVEMFEMRDRRQSILAVEAKVEVASIRK